LQGGSQSKVFLDTNLVVNITAAQSYIVRIPVFETEMGNDLINFGFEAMVQIYQKFGSLADNRQFVKR